MEGGEKPSLFLSLSLVVHVKKFLCASDRVHSPVSLGPKILLHLSSCICDGQKSSGFMGTRLRAPCFLAVSLMGTNRVHANRMHARRNLFFKNHDCRMEAAMRSLHSTTTGTLFRNVFCSLLPFSVTFCMTVVILHHVTVLHHRPLMAF